MLLRGQTRGSTQEKQGKLQHLTKCACYSSNHILKMPLPCWKLWSPKPHFDYSLSLVLPFFLIFFSTFSLSLHLPLCSFLLHLPPSFPFSFSSLAFFLFLFFFFHFFYFNIKSNDIFCFPFLMRHSIDFRESWPQQSHEEMC